MRHRTVKILDLLIGYTHEAAGNGFDDAADIMHDIMSAYGIEPSPDAPEQIRQAIISDHWNQGGAGAALHPQILVATECGKVIKSRWLPKEQRFEMLGSSGIKPHEYWMIYPQHPDKAHEQD